MASMMLTEREARDRRAPAPGPAHRVGGDGGGARHHPGRRQRPPVQPGQEGRRPRARLPPQRGALGGRGGRRQHGRQGPQRTGRRARHQQPGTATMAAGGVGRNVAENLARLGTCTHLVAAIGSDGLGDQVLAATSAPASTSSTPTQCTVDRHLHRPSSTPTASSSSRSPTWPPPTSWRPSRSMRRATWSPRPKLVVLDGNLGTATLGFALDLAERRRHARRARAGQRPRRPPRWCRW